jgi:hypothetical protein
MRPVTVRIMHPEPFPGAGPLTRWLATGRAAIAARHLERFSAAGASDVAIIAGPPDGVVFGARLRSMAADDRPAGLVLLGSGAIPLATAGDLRELVAAAGRDDRVALTNNRYSADVIAIAHAWPTLAELPALDTDNALPRWLETEAGYRVEDLRQRWRLGVDVDGPLDLLLLGRVANLPVDDFGVDAVASAVEGVRHVATNPRAELLIAGRSSAVTLAWLERSTASRTRALIEERGLRTSASGQRRASSVLGALLDDHGPGSLGSQLAKLSDAAVVDSRVLLAHRLGPDDRTWPAPEDRFASDLLLPERIDDPWLRELTASAVAAPIPILLGGHSLVGPGIRLVIGGRSWT